MPLHALMKLGKKVAKSSKKTVGPKKPKGSGTDVKAGRTERSVFGVHSTLKKKKAAMKAKMAEKELKVKKTIPSAPTSGAMIISGQVDREQRRKLR